MTPRQFFWTIAFATLDLPISRSLFQWIWSRMNEHLPVHYLRQTESLLAFSHPKPAYPVHILLVPKRLIPSIKDLTEADGQFLIDVFACAQSLVDELGLDDKGYRLIANGGAYQDIPQLHFHLISEA
jgi:histidine triad (HIT) family protein